MQHVAGWLLLEEAEAPVTLRIRLRNGALACERHVPAHVLRLAAATGHGLHPDLL